MVNELKGNITEQFLTFTEEVHLSIHLFIHSHLLNVPLLSASYLTGSLPDTMDRNVNMKSTEELPAGRGDSCKLPIIMQCVCCCCSVTKLCLTLCDPVDYIACQASLTFTISRSLLKLMPTELMMLSNHLILCCPHLFLSSIFSSITVSAAIIELCTNFKRWTVLGVTNSM